jgi:hypothetical protein
MSARTFTSISFVVAVTAVAAMVIPAASARSAAPARPPVVAGARGIEVFATHTQGTFAGVLSGSLSGSWTAVVEHTQLNPGARITGGTFTLSTTMNGRPRTLRGRFARGSVTNTNPGAGCTNQTFHVVGDIVNVAGAGKGASNGTGVFAVTLTHHRARILGSCVAYFATETGTLTLSV